MKNLTVTTLRNIKIVGFKLLDIFKENYKIFLYEKKDKNKFHTFH